MLSTVLPHRKAVVDPEAPLLRLADSSGEGGGAGGEVSPPSPPEGGGAAAVAGGGGSASGRALPPPPSTTTTTCTRLAWLENNMPGELAKAFLLGKQLGRAHQCVARCYDRYCGAPVIDLLVRLLCVIANDTPAQSARLGASLRRCAGCATFWQLLAE